MVEITYNGNTIAALASGQTATLACKDKIMASDVLITGTCSVEYKGVVIAELAAGQTATLACKDKIMATNVVVTVAESALEPLPTLSITLDGDTLSITDESGLAEEFVILVDGVETETVKTSATVTITNREYDIDPADAIVMYVSANGEAASIEVEIGKTETIEVQTNTTLTIEGNGSGIRTLDVLEITGLIDGYIGNVVCPGEDFNVRGDGTITVSAYND